MKPTPVKRILACLSASLLAAATLWGHHSFSAEFDGNKTMTIKGTITKFEWMNPHAYFYLDAADESGKQVNWGMQSRNLSILGRQGWTKTTLKPGDVITVTFWHHKEADKNIGFAQIIVKADGTKYDVTPGR
jgi:hypothetical protein